MAAQLDMTELAKTVGKLEALTEQFSRVIELVHEQSERIAILEADKANKKEMSGLAIFVYGLLWTGLVAVLTTYLQHIWK